MPEKKGGPRLKLTAKSKKTLVDAIKHGNYHHIAAAKAGIHVSTFYRYMDLGERRANGATHDDDGKEIPDILADLFNEIQAAEAEAETRRIARIEKAGRLGDWKADAWYLQHRYPDRWGRKDRLTADVNHAGTVTNQVVDLSYMSDDELKQELKKYE